MASLRVVIIRCSLALNALLVMYLCVTWSSTPLLHDHHDSFRNPGTIDYIATSSSHSPAPYEVAVGVGGGGVEAAEMVAPPVVGVEAAPAGQDMGVDSYNLGPPPPDVEAVGDAGHEHSGADNNSGVGAGVDRSSLGARRTLAQQGIAGAVSSPEQNLDLPAAQGHGPAAATAVEQPPAALDGPLVLDQVQPPAEPAAGILLPYPSSEPEEPPREVQESAGVTEQLVAAPLPLMDAPDPPLDSLEHKMYPDLRDCGSKSLRPFYHQRGDYWMLENYIPAAMSFRCDESITYSTHADYTFLDNLEPLTSRWQGPVSISVYAPGDDFAATINTILYLRDCWAEGIKKYVTFHLLFHISHTPKQVPSTEELLKRKTECALEPPKWTNVTTYRMAKKLLYPVNVARNTARMASQTYFVFPSDIELYPSINFIPEFFKMLKKPDISKTNNPRVFVFSIFEVKENVTAPETKTELQKMLKTGDAISFHQYVCARCHNVPHTKEWQAAQVQPGLSVFHIGKRAPPFHKWEPIYVGTNKDPLYDERLSWEGKSDKMTQMYILCVRDYEFHIVDNAFLVHKPGIKRVSKDPLRDKIVYRQNAAIKTNILPEYKTIFGSRKSCVI